MIATKIIEQLGLSIGAETITIAEKRDTEQLVRGVEKATDMVWCGNVLIILSKIVHAIYFSCSTYIICIIHMLFWLHTIADLFIYFL